MLAAEEKAKLDLITRFPFLEGKVRIQRVRRLWADVPPEAFADVFAYATGAARFSLLCTITGLDQGATFAAHYHLARESGEMLTLTVAVPRERPVIHTVTAQFPSADAYERELVDLLGFTVEGLATGTRYPLPDDWPVGQHPLRKDWQPAAAATPPQEAGHVR